MRRTVATIVVCLAAVSCARVEAQEPVAIATTRQSTTTTTTTLPPSTTTSTAVTTTTQVELDVDSLPEGSSLVLGAREPVAVFAEPGQLDPVLTLDPTTYLGSTTVLTVLDGPDEGWARVMLPGRPNGSEGWVRSDDMVIFVVEGRLVVDLSDRTLAYYEGKSEVLSTPVAVGSGRNPTPTGTFFVTDNVTLSDPESIWGPHALGLSARSDTITEYRGADGIIGIHGTNRPGSIGEAASLGCVRVPNEVITRLHELVRIGTPVEIRA